MTGLPEFFEQTSNEPYDRSFQKSMSLRRWGAVIDGSRMYFDDDMRTSLSETFVDYHIHYSISNKYNN